MGTIRHFHFIASVMLVTVFMLAGAGATASMAMLVQVLVRLGVMGNVGARSMSAALFGVLRFPQYIIEQVRLRANAGLFVRPFHHGGTHVAVHPAWSVKIVTGMTHDLLQNSITRVRLRVLIGQGDVRFQYLGYRLRGPSGGWFVEVIDVIDIALGERMRIFLIEGLYFCT